MSKKIIAILIIAVVFVGAAGLINWVPRYEMGPITGYSGMTSSFVDIEHNYDSSASIETISQTTAGLKLTGLVDAATPTGLRAELGQPQVYSTRQDWADSISVVDETAETNTTKTWEAHIVTCHMGLTIRTDGTGLATVYNVQFWIQLQENSFSVFQDADESIAFILEVRTYDEADESDTSLVEVQPASGGYSFPLTTVDTDPIPAWLTQSGYSGNLQNFKAVKFPVEVVEMTPSSFWLILRNEVQATFYIEIDVLLFGYWEVVSPYVPWIEPDLGTWLDVLIAWLQQSLIIVAGFVAMVIILYLAPSKWKLLGPVIFLVALAYSLGFFDAFLGAPG